MTVLVGSKLRLNRFGAEDMQACNKGIISAESRPSQHCSDKTSWQQVAGTMYCRLRLVSDTTAHTFSVSAHGLRNVSSWT